MTQNSENKPNNSPIQPDQNESSHPKSKKALSWWLSKTVTVLGLVYLFFVVFIPPDSKFKVNKIGNTEILLFAVILLFNSGLLDKLEDFSIDGTKIQAKFRKLEELEAAQKSQEEILKQLESQQRTLQLQQESLDGLLKVTQSDAKSLFLVEQQLNPEFPEVSQEDLDNALANTSTGFANNVLNRTKYLRQVTWRSNKKEDQVLLRRTIPIFKALTKHEILGQYHTCHGELGFALKDKHEPDWAASLESLTKAINLRGSSKSFEDLFYEFSRAVCRIQIYGDDPEMCEEIKKDLTAAAAHRDVLNAKRINDPINPNMRGWMEQNGIKLEDLYHSPIKSPL
jgi:hypothetical protein